MLRPEMKPVDPGTPGVGRPSKPKPEPEESRPTYVPGGGRPGHPEPAQESQPPAGPPAFDAGPSPYYTQEVTSYAQPPSSDEEAQRREERKDRATERWEKARKRASAVPTPPETVGVPDIDDIRFGHAVEELEFPIDPVDVEYHIAAQHNPVLRELRLMRQLQGIPPALQRHPDLLLSYCAEQGMDEEHDAEARGYLEYCKNGGSRYFARFDPLQIAWEEALAAYERSNAEKENWDARAAFASEVDAYKKLVEETYGVEFTHDVDPEKDTSWDLLGIRMAHVAFEEMAKALGIAVDAYFKLDWDDATAFRMVFGKTTVHNAIEPMPRDDDGSIKGLAQVEGRIIKIYWNEGEKRNAYIIPNTMLHELGHILNSNGAFGVDQFRAWFNLHEDHPGSRTGMGAPAADVLIGTNVIRTNNSDVQLPTLAQEIGVWNPDHVIFDETRDWFPRQIQSLQQSKVASKNEITADAILNWVKHLISEERFGFTSGEEGLNWQQFMEANIDDLIRNAIVHNTERNEGPIDVSHLGGYPVIYGLATVQAPSGLNLRSTPIVSKSANNILTTLTAGEKLAILGRSKDSKWIATERYGVLAWMSAGEGNNQWVELPEGLLIEDLPEYEDRAGLGPDPQGR